MVSVANHYETHLAPIYLWMAGGIEHALSLGASDVSQFLERPGYAVDLGAGFGMHSIPLAKSGYRVLSVDTSRQLLNDLLKYSSGLDVTAVEADLLDFSIHMSGAADLILCMGDTLTHLPDTRHVEELFQRVAKSLRSGGQFVATFRDYRELPTGDQRFIPVRSDAERILTCFLEEKPEHFVVHDIVHERVQDAWVTKVSSYEKLRLSPSTVTRAAEAAGMRCHVEPGPRGMLKVLASI